MTGVYTPDRLFFTDSEWALTVAPTARAIADAAAAAGVQVVYSTVKIDYDQPGVEVTGGADGSPVWRVKAVPMGGLINLHPVSIVLLTNDEQRNSGPWYGMSWFELLAAFRAWEKLTGSEWGDSVGRSAQSLILATHPPAKGGTRLDRDLVLPEFIQNSSLEMPYQAWMRERTREEQGARWIHLFDANAQYLAAWQAAELGHGNPRHVRAPFSGYGSTASASVLDLRTPGFWRIPRPELPRNYFPLLPDPCLPDREWFATPTVARMLEVCDGHEAPMISEAWLWSKHSRFLRGAGERLRDTRVQSRELVAKARDEMGRVADDDALRDLAHKSVVAGAVEEAVKDVYTRQTGRFGMVRAGQSVWYRPDWGHLVRATARANLHRRLAKLGAFPFAIMTDGLVFQTNEADPVTFATRIGLPLGSGLGQYRYELSIPAAAAEEVTNARQLAEVIRMCGLG